MAIDERSARIAARLGDLQDAARRYASALAGEHSAMPRRIEELAGAAARYTKAIERAREEH
jgi:hypothetical protein